MHALATAVSILLASTACAGELTVIPATGGFMTGVSADGRVVSGYGAQYFYWTKETGSIFIGGIAPGDQGAGGSSQMAGDGNRLCGNILNSQGKVEAAIYDIAAGEWQSLGNLGGSCDINASTAWGISSDGSTVVGGVYPSACSHRAMRWSQSTSMGTLYSWFGWTTRANSANADGSVVVGWQDIDTGFRQGCLWTNGVQTRLASPTGVRMGEAGCCTQDGSTVFGFGNFNDGNGQVPYRWTSATKAVPLGPSPNPASGYATDCSADGSVIACFFRWGPPAVSGEGYAWISGRGFVELEVLAEESGAVVAPGVRLSLPLAVSADGKTIVGAGRSDAGQVIFVLDMHSERGACPADLNLDSVVSGLDLSILLGAWGQSGIADINQDGVVSGTDLSIMLGSWGTCPEVP
jgi:uncharacterized membrane protein